MSVAEPAHPAPSMSSPGDAAVIDISTRITQPAARGRWKEVTSRPGDGPDTWQKNAQHFEGSFNEHPLNLTLSDDETAGAFTVTVGIVRGLLAGAHATGVIGEEQLAELDALMEGMLSAPGLV